MPDTNELGAYWRAPMREAFLSPRHSFGNQLPESRSEVWAIPELRIVWLVPSNSRRHPQPYLRGQVRGISSSCFERCDRIGRPGPANRAKATCASKNIAFAVETTSRG